MSESKHTPWPWKYNHGLIYFRKADRLIHTELVVGAKGEWVAAVINDYEDGTPVKVQEANANLIAAAPELLEALEGLLSEVKHLEQDYPEDYNFKPYHDAISKAKGLPK